LTAGSMQSAAQQKDVLKTKCLSWKYDKRTGFQPQRSTTLLPEVPKPRCAGFCWGTHDVPKSSSDIQLGQTNDRLRIETTHLALQTPSGVFPAEVETAGWCQKVYGSSRCRGVSFFASGIRGQ
jgi:hypothetical protein